MVPKKSTFHTQTHRMWYFSHHWPITASYMWDDEHGIRVSLHIYRKDELRSYIYLRELVIRG